MWSTLKSDLSEFVTTVKEDTSNALSNLDDGIDTAAESMANESLTPEEKEVERRIALRETFTAPLAVREDMPSEEATDLEAYLKDFAIDSKTDEIAALLEDNDALKAVFESLTDEVEYADFWQRYFFRCDAERIRDEWDAEEQRAAEARQQAVSKTIGNVTGFLGGAVKNLTATLGESDVTPPPSGGFMTKNQAKKAGLLNTGRPPFVMNTAVDESGDEDEEELGWDDDDDDDDDDDVDEEEGEETGDEAQDEEIEFKDPAAEKLQEELKQAIEERDQLHQTVEMQTKQIAELQAAATGAPSPTNSGDMEKMKMELFDKEAELAALRSSVMDNSMSAPASAVNDAQIAALEAKVKKLEEDTATKATALKSVQSDLDATRTESKEAQEALEKALADVARLESTLSNAQDSGNSDKAMLQSKLEDLQKAHEKTQQELSSFHEKAVLTEKEMIAKTTALTTELTSSKDAAKEIETKFAAEQAKVLELQNKCEELQKEFAASQRQKDECSDGGTTGKSVDTATSAVKVEVPTTAATNDDDEADGWDDDW